MAKADNSVSHFNWKQAGAPSLSGQIGKALDVMRAVLVTGYGLSSVDSAVIAGSVCTLTISAGHSQIVDGVCEIAGVTTPAVLNGKWKVKAITATTVTFDMDTIADQTATGAITVKVASLGWTEAFTGTNIACFKSSDVTSNGHYLRVDDSVASPLRVIGYESMTAHSTGVNPFPTAAQLAGGAYWPKATTANATVHPWLAWGDSKGFYWCPAPALQTTDLFPQNANPFFFGDPISLLSTDLYGTILCAGISTSAVEATGGQVVNAFNCGGGQVWGWTPRPYYNLGTSQSMDARHDFSTSYLTSGTTYPFPPLDGKILISGVSVFDGAAQATGVRRSIMPGIYTTAQNCGPAFKTFDILPNPTGPLAGKHVMAVVTGPPNGGSTSGYGVGFVDLTGPWR